MPFTRCHARQPCSTMVTKRQGGRVSLFNYNPSIAGGKLAVMRYGSAHRRGSYLLGKTHNNNVHTVGKGGGLESSATAHSGTHHSIHHGMGAPMMSATHERAASRKRILDSIANHMGSNKRR